MNRALRLSPLFFAIVLIWGQVLHGQSTWQWQNPLPHGNELTAMSFVDGNIGTAVGFAGTIVRTTDGGTTWVPQPSGTGVTLNAVWCTDANTATAVGFSGTILRTTDGGATWNQQVSGVSITLRGVHFTDATTGTVVGSSSTILRTTDGGATWTPQTSPVTAANFAVYFFNTSTGIIVGQNGAILRTTNGGTDWTSQPSGVPTVILRAISFPDANNGFVVGAASGTVLKTTDGGVTWSPVTSGTTAALTGVSFNNPTTGSVVGSGGTIRRTTDGGATWTAQTSGTTNGLNAVRFLDASVGLTIGATGVTLRTTNGGDTWTNQQQIITSNNLRSVSFTDANTGTAVGYPGTILRTTDGGASWTHQTSPLPSASFYSIKFTSPSTAVIVGSGGTVLRTTNAGETWMDNSVTSVQHFQAVAFPTPAIGYLVGSGGTVMKTTNGGETWTSQSTGTSNWLYALSFSDENHGTAVGDAETIIRTTNGGATWTVQNSGVFPSYEGVWFTDANTGTLVGATGVIRRTTDGGATWDYQVSGTANAFRAVRFFDTNTGIAVGLSGLITRTSDGGSTWNLVNGVTANNLWAVSYLTPYTGTLVGDPGTILRETGIAPHAPLLSSPSNGAANVSVNPTLSWNLSMGATSYRLQVATDSTFVSPVVDENGIVTTSYAVAGLSHGIVHWWRVKAFSAEGESDWSSIWSFTTIGPFPPQLLSAEDVPNDQGGKVTVKWSASALDTNVATLPFYSIWRALPEGAHQPSQLVSAEEDIRLDFAGPAWRTETFNGVTYAWEWIANQPAHRIPLYSYTSATLYDSTSQTDGKHYFMVSAHSSDPNVFYDSNPDSGYSVDNLPPLAPGNVVGTLVTGQVILHWTPNTESDIAGYEIYRSDLPNFDPDTMVAYAVTSDTIYTDINVPTTTNSYYALRAVDVHENRSPKSNEVAIIVVKVDERSGLPSEFALGQNYPNPFNPTTQIRYALPKESHVRLTLYNVLGQHVATLVDEPQLAGYVTVTWDGRSGLRNAIGSGLYFYRIEAVPLNGDGAFVQVRKAILLK